MAPPPAGRQGASPDAFVDANGPRAHEAATNEPKQGRMREEKARMTEKGQGEIEGKQQGIWKELAFAENPLWGKQK